MFANDVRFALRMLSNRLGYAALVVFTLGLGIGASTTVFTVVDGVLLRPLPFAQVDRLVEISMRDSGSANASVYVTAPQADHWRAQPALFDATADYRDGPSLVLETEEPEQLRTVRVSRDFFSLLGVPAHYGRTFASDEADGDAQIAVVSDRLWRTALGARPDAVGNPLRLSGTSYTVIGVMPPDFRYPMGPVDVWLPSAHGATLPGRAYMQMFARLRPGLDVAGANSTARHLASAVAHDAGAAASYPFLIAMGAWRANRDMESALYILSGAVACVLLIACVNAANLMLVQATAREHQIGVRLALGATRGRIVRELVIESFMLAAASALVGVALAWAGVHLVVGIAPSELTSWSYAPIGIDARVLVFTITIAAVTGLVFGVFPSLQVGRTRMAAIGGDRSRGATRAQRRLRAVLVTGELALSAMLLVGAGLLVRSFLRLSNVDPGMEVGRMAVLDVSPARQRYANAPQRAAFYDAVTERMRAIPGVERVSVGSGTAGRAGGISFGVELQAEGSAPLARQPDLLPRAYVDTAYFGTVGMPLRAGRPFLAEDFAPNVNAVIITVDLAHALWPDGNAVGRRFRTSSDESWQTVVGVVNDVRLMGADDRSGRFELIEPAPNGSGGQRSIIVRTRGNPGLVLAAMRAAVHAIDPLQPVLNVSTGEDRYRASLQKPRFLLRVMEAFSVVALVLAVIGLYGVISYTVAQRTREIGIRVALGAQASHVAGRVLGDGMRITAIGIALGVVGAAMLSRFLTTLLYGVSATDPSTYALIALGIVMVSMVAVWVPARRASRVDPVEALRAE